MAKNRNDLTTLLRDEEGLSPVEYIIILVLTAVLGIAVWTPFGATVRTQVQSSDTAIGNLGTGN